MKIKRSVHLEKLAENCEVAGLEKVADKIIMPQSEEPLATLPAIKALKEKEKIGDHGPLAAMCLDCWYHYPEHRTIFVFFVHEIAAHIEVGKRLGKLEKI